MKNYVKEWNGFTKNDPLRVTGVRGSYRFSYAELDENGEAKAVFVCGGISGHSGTRVFVPERILKPKKTRTRKINFEEVA